MPQAYRTKSIDPIWYLPHHPVTNVHKPKKVRVVFDSAAKCNELSLNDTLVKGATIMNSLIGVLIRFRKNRIALVADVEAMFHQVKSGAFTHECLAISMVDRWSFEQ